jgi:SAM-dependent methyltransferase
VRKWESQFWEHPVAPGVFAAPIDTTFALYPPRAEFSNEACNLRLGSPYLVEHTPWYVDESSLDDEERHYRMHTSTVHSNWSVPQKDSWVKKSARVAAFDQRPVVLHLDSGREHIPGWINANATARHDVVAFDVTGARHQRLPLDDGSVDGIHLSHVLQSVRDAQPLFDELWRVAKPDAKLVVRVQHGAREHAAPERAWYEGSFAHFAAPVAGHCGRSDWQLQALRLIEDDNGAAQEVIAVLQAVKPARTPINLHPAPQVPLQRTNDARFDPAFTAVAQAVASPA